MYNVHVYSTGKNTKTHLYYLSSRPSVLEYKDSSLTMATKSTKSTLGIAMVACLYLLKEKVNGRAATGLLSNQSHIIHLLGLVDPVVHVGGSA